MRRAFQVCKDLESKEQWVLFKANSGGILLDLTPACAARVLGFALLYFPSDNEQNTLTAEILKCNDDHELLSGLAYLYVYGLIRVCTSSIAFWLLSC